MVYSLIAIDHFLLGQKSSCNKGQDFLYLLLL